MAHDKRHTIKWLVWVVFRKKKGGTLLTEHHRQSLPEVAITHVSREPLELIWFGSPGRVMRGWARVVCLSKVIGFLNIVRVRWRRVVSDWAAAATPAAHCTGGAGTAARSRRLLRILLEGWHGVQDAGERREDGAYAHIESSVGLTGVLLDCGTRDFSHLCNFTREREIFRKLAFLCFSVHWLLDCVALLSSFIQNVDAAPACQL